MRSPEPVEPRTGDCEASFRPATVWQPDLRDDAVAEAQRLHWVRRVGGRRATTDQDAILMTTIPLSRARPPLSASSLVWLVRVHLVDANGQLIERVLVPLLGGAPWSHEVQGAGCAVHKPRALRAFVETFLAAAHPSLFERALGSASRRLQHIGDAHAAALGVARARERYLMSRIEADRVGRQLFQGGLFDRRAARDRDAALSGQARMFGDAVARIEQLEAAAGPAVATDAELVLVLQVSGRRSGR